MQKLSKIVSKQDANFKFTPSNSNETSINLPGDISNLISDESGEVSFTLYKADFIRALSALCLIDGVYFKKEHEFASQLEIFSELSKQISAQFGDSETSVYTVYHFKREDGRFYLNNLKKSNGFNIRSFLVEQSSVLTFQKDEKGNMSIRLEASVPKSDVEVNNLEVVSDSLELDQPLQQIFFGAPGTGKSFEINKMCAKYENYRTTFHPDTDYSSFVGSYKPITTKVPVYTSYGNTAMIMKDKDGNDIMEDRIVYRYVFQSFLKAYIAAWKEQQKDNPNPVFLIVEEINRGNCAQVFGDIFQLLDRNESGYSDYPIVADDDLAQELKRMLGDLEIANHDRINNLYKGGKDVVAMVKEGSHLLLPNNLYIWATMNTSDQSLFPIDSAFKRRWDWKYIKIRNSSENYKIKFSNGNTYDWWEFVTTINERIEGGDIQQEDKKLGYFFAKAKNGFISPEIFLSKVIFFLYNDVFKDFGLEEPFFRDENGDIMTFAKYFDENGVIKEDRVERFLNNLDIYPEDIDGDVFGGPEISDDIKDIDDNGGKKKPPTPILSIKIGDSLSLEANGLNAINFLIKFFKTVGIDRISKFEDLKHGTFQVVIKSNDNPYEKYYKKYVDEHGERYYIHTYNSNESKRKFIKQVANKFYPGEPLTILPLENETAD